MGRSVTSPTPALNKVKALVVVAVKVEESENRALARHSKGRSLGSVAYAVALATMLATARPRDNN